MASTGNTASVTGRGTSSGLSAAHALSADKRRGERRRGARFVLRERRSGYDRRKDVTRRALVPACVHDWCRAHRWVLPASLIATNLLSLADLALTLRVLDAGAIEVNPLLKALLDLDVRIAAGVKAALVATASLLIWRYRWHRKILPLSLLALAVFALVVAYQATLLLTAW